MSNLTGATFLANQFRTMISDAKAKLAKAGEDMTVAVTELHETAEHAVAQVKIVQNETADLKAALGLGSNGGEPLNDTVTTPLPKLEYEKPEPFMGPALPPAIRDTGDVKQIKLDNGEPKIGFM